MKIEFGSIMYCLICIRSDLAYVISIVSQYMANLEIIHWQALKCVLKYLNGILKDGLKYTRACQDENA